MGEHIHIIYHADWDGIVAAWVVQNALKTKPGVVLEFHSINYNDKMPNIPGHHAVYIVDFAFPPEVFIPFCEGRTGRVVMMDHHKTAIAKYYPDPDTPELCCHKLPDNAWLLMEDGIAGCELAWRYFHDVEQLKPPLLVKYTADHDLWKFGQPESKLVRAALRSWPMTIESCDQLHEIFSRNPEHGWRPLVADGRAIQRFKDRIIESAVNHAEWLSIKGHRCLATQMPVANVISEVAGELAAKDGSEFGVCWFKNKGDTWTYSLRSRDDFDVSEVAKQFPGGGGHAKAAGFTTNISPVALAAEERAR